ncbi:MarR family winged helix-turn-helix transcriptional regulator [Methylobacterium sp.]|jgi:DNA-binding MarR family transcriptional regulator|uniref:MarR family winged helix-turn-helix transcriptional regulator n=1 Tax=Methylobacterium sp. TaxID=409 RepID=UPI003B02203A
MSPDVTRQSTLATSPPPIPPSGENDGLADSGLAPEGVPVSDNGITNDLVELLFFAYRDFVGDPDRMLAEYGFGRAHHRVLHFVYHYPGLTIAELLDILRITKQSLNRVLKDLIEQGHIVQKTGRSDRRQRLLYCSETGATLTAELTRVQVRRVARAIADPVGDGPKDARDKSGFAAAQGFLMAMIEPEERAAVTSLMARRARSRP